ncbi:MAG: S1 RNA-binding domain-containing protein, partial [Spirochaetaceae bacterium]|nr:S1 RNA-binding domain-containing protein [Spirochaetaceae bacterium]
AALAFEDLYEGMALTGKIKNVVDFGAFVDLGIKETALAHISEMGGGFVKDLLDAVKAGDILEFRVLKLDPDRRRIALTRKPLCPETPRRNLTGPAGGREKQAGNGGKRGERERPGNGEKAGPAGKPPGAPARNKPPSEDDGTMYSPFAEALKKMREKQAGK